ncbi:hypothetical protein BO83DRAFT_454123 [Aspergillus eucalypticola CBS 122712]|uniref:Uncharacterized protein n=1 Tax=Aspergillus eucalypticola (strain CBS 122712 / IBT 29274) TaxID=1448314 RepID=A0A317W6Y2_ASPEC|nr:uncharacterized protein BO83DRAFT_454123 [Aspergillus eucalypticola CBS 122712]PWY82394.1 hypothetical protein BO83DRAFT_454123 [Aspergillus eucalypticola CBS 122712]
MTDTRAPAANPITINPPANTLPPNVATRTVRVANMTAHDFYPAPPAPQASPAPQAPPAPPAPPTPSTAAAPLLLGGNWSDALVRTIERSSQLQQDLRGIALRMGQLSREYEALAREIHRPRLLGHLGEICMHAVAQHTNNPAGVAAVRRAMRAAIDLLNPQGNANQPANNPQGNANQPANNPQANANP